MYSLVMRSQVGSWRTSSSPRKMVDERRATISRRDSLSIVSCHSIQRSCELEYYSVRNNVTHFHLQETGPCKHLMLSLKLVSSTVLRKSELELQNSSRIKGLLRFPINLVFVMSASKVLSVDSINGSNPGTSAVVDYIIVRCGPFAQQDHLLLS